MSFHDVLAFPVVNPATGHQMTGMSLLDYFAGQACVGVIASDLQDVREFKTIALVSYNIALEMMEQRKALIRGELDQAVIDSRGGERRWRAVDVGNQSTKSNAKTAFGRASELSVACRTNAHNAGADRSGRFPTRKVCEPCAK